MTHLYAIMYVYVDYLMEKLTTLLVFVNLIFTPVKKHIISPKNQGQKKTHLNDC